MTITELHENILKRLGYPLHNVEITTDQLNIQITDCLDYFYNWNNDGFERVIVPLSLTQGTSEYTLATSIMNVTMYINSSNISGFPSFKKLYWETMLQGGNAVANGVAYYSIANAYLKDLDTLLGNKYDFTFNKLTHTFRMVSTVAETMNIGLVCTRNLSGSLENIYSDVWFQKYCTALCKKQWGENISKYDKKMLNDASLNYQRILTEAEEEKTKLERELYEDRNSGPVFMIG